MSVLMTLRVKGSRRRSRSGRPRIRAVMQAILAKAKPHGPTSHRFYASDEIMVVDEWESKASAASSRGHRDPRSDGTSEPQITFWRRLETHDAYPV